MNDCILVVSRDQDFLWFMSDIISTLPFSVEMEEAGDIEKAGQVIRESKCAVSILEYSAMEENGRTKILQMTKEVARSKNILFLFINYQQESISLGDIDLENVDLILKMPKSSRDIKKISDEIARIMGY